MADNPNAEGGASPLSEGGAAAAPAAEPTPLSVTPDTLIKLDGHEKPVKFGEHIRGFQSQFTKASQRAAELEKKLIALEAAQKERDAELSRYRQFVGNGQPKSDPNADLIEALRTKQYLSGEEAAGVVSAILQRVEQAQNGFNPRDTAILTIAKRLAEAEKRLGGFAQERSEREFKARISGVVKELGLPDEASELAEEIYLAYTGDDLDQEFPSILSKRWEQLEKLVRARDKAKLEAARAKPFVPGKGGLGSAQKPLNTAKLTAREIADQVWEGLSGSDS